VAFKTYSSFLNSYLFFLFISWKDRMAKTDLPFVVLNLSFKEALVSGRFESQGSWMNVFPDWVWGGIDPAHIALRLSIIVVLPAPFCPRMSVNGLKNSIFCSSQGLKLLMPLMLSLSIELI
jgi:hypothetical protein